MEMNARRIELLGLLALIALGAALRAWHLWDVPSPTDELLGVARGLAIARGELLPLTDYEPYIGALWNYLLAGLYLAFGQGEYIHRLLPLLVGVLTIPAAYLLGRELAGPLAGWVAAALLATSSAHILATSHPAWSHSMMPLFDTLALWQLHRGLRIRDGRGLLAAGFWLGLSLQAHLTSLALLPGALVYFWLKGRDWLKTPWPYLAGLLSLLLIANILLFNLQTGLGTVRRASQVSEAYARPKEGGENPYLGNLQRMGVSWLRTIGGSIDVRERPQDFVLDPATLGPGLLALVGLGLLARRGCALALLVFLSYSSLLAVFNAKYEAIPNARFLTPLLPLLFAATGAVAATAWWRAPRRRRLLGPALALALAGLVAVSLAGLARRYDQMADSAQVTARLSDAVQEVEAARRPDEPVLLDRNLDRLWLDGGGELHMYVSFELTRRRVPVADLPRRVDVEVNSCRRYQVTLVPVDLDREAPAWLRSALGPDPSRLPRRFWTFRAVLRDPRPGTLGPDERVLFEYLPPLSGSSRAVDRCAPGRQI